ncbi:MAG: hypothetical protein ACXABY_18490, partial [Candidatus Thorarchaeota archaeon]
MKRVLPLVVTILFLAGIFIVPAGVMNTPARLQESLLDREEIEPNMDESWLPPDKIVKVAVYSENNLTAPAYATGSGVLHNNDTGMRDILLLYGYDVTLLTTNDIFDHELTTTNFDIFLIVDNYPRENVTNQVTEFWKSGGGLISFGNAAGFLCYFGILPPEAALSSGHGVYWLNTADAVNITARHPVSQRYQLYQTLAESPAVELSWIWSALQGTSIANDLTMVARSNNNANYASVIAYDPSTVGGGKVVAFSGDNSGASYPELYAMISDAVEWLCPRPKARIAFDLSHNPSYGLDDYDGDYCGSTVLTHTEMRDELVKRGYTFDKLYPPDGGELTASVLAAYDMLVILSPVTDYTSSEVSSVTNWISSGGSILAISDHYVSSGVSQLNNLLSNTDLSHNMTDAGSSALVQIGTHPTHEGSSDMTGANVGLVVASGDAVVTWNDDQGRAVVGADELGNGRVILAPDQAFFRDGRMQIADNLASFLSMSNWLTSGNAKVLAFIDKNIIVDDPNDIQYRGPVAQALNELGVSWYFTGEEQTWQYLNLSLHQYEWDLVVIDQFSTNLNFLWGDLLDYVKSGERLIYQSMQLNQLVNNAQAFRDYVGVKYPQGPITPTPPSYFWPGSNQILTSPRNYGANNLSVVENYGFPTCQNLTYHDNGTALAGLSKTKPGSNINATIILGVGGDVLVNGVMVTAFDNDTDDSAYKDNFELWQNEIAFMLRPTVDSPTDMTIEVGSRTESVVWNAYSDRPDHFSIVRNSFEILNEPWDGGPINLPLEEDNLGAEEFHLTVYDELGFSAADTVAVTKEDTTSPLLISVTENPEYEEGTVWYLVNWTFDERFPDSFAFYINETYETGGSWDGSLISVNAGHLSPGVYNLTLFVSDTSGNSASEMVYLTV